MHPYAHLSIQVSVEFLPDRSNLSAGLYAFGYTVRIANDGQCAAQIVARHWRIHDAQGNQEEVRGLGIVGEQPVLQPGEHHIYSSWVPLQSPSGTMEGHFICLTDTADVFEASIAPFELRMGNALH